MERSPCSEAKASSGLVDVSVLISRNGSSFSFPRSSTWMTPACPTT